MAFKIIILTAFVAAANAGNLISAPIATTYAAAPLLHSASLVHHAPLAYNAPIAKVAAPLAVAAPIAKAVVAEEYDPNPQYSFGYDVQDSLTGDSKSQVESRNGDVVQGAYSLIDSDGFKRTVEYTADPINGFNAIVHREPLVAKAAVVATPAIAKVAAPLAYAAPAVAKIAYTAPAVATPVAYAAPAVATPVSYAAPAIAKFAAPLAYSTSVVH